MGWAGAHWTWSAVEGAAVEEAGRMARGLFGAEPSAAGLPSVSRGTRYAGDVVAEDVDAGDVEVGHVDVKR